jgi:hypothetical protein
MEQSTNKTVYPFYIDPSLFELDGLNENIFWLLMKLAKRMNTNDRTCFPSISTLVQDTGWSRRKVYMVLDEIVSIGLITKTQREDKAGDFTSNLYTICTNKIGFIKFEGLNHSFSLSDNNDDGGSANISLPSAKNAPTGSAKNAPLTNNPIINSSLSLHVEEKITGIKGNPNYAKAQSLQFPDLTEEEIDLTLAVALDQDKNLSVASAFTWLTNKNRDKTRGKAATFNKSRPSLQIDYKQPEGVKVMEL